MNNFDFINFVTNTQISTALVLIVVLLTYIAWRLTDMSKHKKGSSRSTK